MTTVGGIVIPRPGARWASEDIGGKPLEVVSIHPYPDSVGGPVYVCRWPGTTTIDSGPHLQADQLEAPVDVYSTIINCTRKQADALGEPSHIRQIRALATATSLTDFARKLVAAGLEQANPHAKDPYAGVVRNLRTYYGSEPTGNTQEIAAATARPDQVLIAPMNGIDGPYLPWPGEDTVLHPVKPKGKRSPEYVLLRLDRPAPAERTQVWLVGAGEFLGEITTPIDDNSPRPYWWAFPPDYDASARRCADRADAIRELLKHADAVANREVAGVDLR